MSEKLDNLHAQFQAVRVIGSTGEKLASGTIAVIKSIDDILAGYNEVMQSQEKTDQFIEMAGVSGLEYAGTVALILTEARAKIEALG